MEVRPATAGDVPDVREIARETWHAAYDDVVGSDAVDEQVAEWYTPESVEQGVSDPDWPYLLAEDGGSAVGYTAGGPTDDGPADGVVAAIYVRPAYWGEGAGSALLEALHERLRTEGCESVWLAVLADNDVGRSFYDDHGYEIHDERTVEIGGVEAAELLLRREL